MVFEHILRTVRAMVMKLGDIKGLGLNLHCETWGWSRSLKVKILFQGQIPKLFKVNLRSSKVTAITL